MFHLAQDFTPWSWSSARATSCSKSAMPSVFELRARTGRELVLPVSISSFWGIEGGLRGRQSVLQAARADRGLAGANLSGLGAYAPQASRKVTVRGNSLCREAQYSLQGLEASNLTCTSIPLAGAHDCHWQQLQTQENVVLDSLLCCKLADFGAGRLGPSSGTFSFGHPAGRIN